MVFNFSFGKKTLNKVFTTPDKKIIVIFGGSGNLKEVLFKEKREDCFIINVSRSRELEGPGIYNMYFDIFKVSPETILQQVINIFGRIDMVVYGIFSTRYKSIDTLKDEDLYRECYISVNYPIKIMKTLEVLWGSDKKRSTLFNRKFIAISSGVSFGINKKREDLAAYSMFKSGMNLACEYYSVRFGKIGVQTIVLCPGSFKNNEVSKKFNNIFWSIVMKGEALDDPFILKKIY